MKAFFVPSLSLAALFLSAFASAYAQAPGRRPTVSPYLELTRPGGSATQNYYGLVKPQVEFRNSIQQLEQQGSAPAASAGGDLPPGAITTGHRSLFFSHSRYFIDRKSTRLNSSHIQKSRMPSSA